MSQVFKLDFDQFDKKNYFESIQYERKMIRNFKTSENNTLKIICFRITTQTKPRLL